MQLLFGYKVVALIIYSRHTVQRAYIYVTWTLDPGSVEHARISFSPYFNVIAHKDTTKILSFFM